jgi:hypothetical protein
LVGNLHGGSETHRTAVRIDASYKALRTHSNFAATESTQRCRNAAEDAFGFSDDLRIDTAKDMRKFFALPPHICFPPRVPSTLIVPQVRRTMLRRPSCSARGMHFVRAIGKIQ